MGKKRPNGYWTPKRVLTELKRIKRENNLSDYPSGKDLRDLGYVGLRNIVNCKYGGIARFLRSQEIKTNKLSRNDWQKLDYVLRIAKEIIKKHKWKKLPHNKTLQKYGYSSLACAISKYGGGFCEFRKLLGEDSRIKNGLWKDKKFVLEKALEAMNGNGWNELPSAEILIDSGYSCLSVYISRYHGGFPSFKEKLREYLKIPSENHQLESMLEDYAGGSK